MSIDMIGSDKSVTLVCDDTFDGIMTAVYDGWVYMNKGYRVHIHPGRDYAPTFFSEFVTIDTDIDKAVRVAKSIRVKISVEAYKSVYRACMHYDEDRADEVFEFLKLGYQIGERVTKMLSNPHVMRIMELCRKAMNEAHLFKEFVRFDELQGNILYSKIEPKCDVISLISEHFSRRFPGENFIIYDAKRKKSIVHQHNTDCIMIENQDMEQFVKDLQQNDKYVDLWKIFYNTIGIEARYNPKCQQTHLPLWYRKNMTEMKE